MFGRKGLDRATPQPATRISPRPSAFPVLRYRQRVRLTRMLAVVLFFGAGTIVIGHIALTNDRGLLIDHLIPLDTSQATVFYYVLTLFSAGFVAVGLGGVLHWLKGDEWLLLDEQGINGTVGSILKSKQCRVAYASVRTTQTTSYRSTHIFKIMARNGRSHTIISNFFESDQQFNDFLMNLADRCHIIETAAR
jgi:hypothetical protein